MSREISTEEQGWIEEYCNECISADAFVAFERALAVKPALREALAQYMALDTHLREGSESLSQQVGAWAPDPPLSMNSGVRMWPWALSLGMAAAVVMGMFLWFQAGADDEQVAQRAEPTAAGFGVLTREDRAQWTNQPSLSTGDLLPDGLLELAAGVVQVELFSGVTLVLEGPASFEVQSPMALKVNRGKVRALVPEPALGFRLLLPEGEVVDLGTEFAVEADSLVSEIHVFDGQVAWKSVSSPERVLVEGQAIRLAGDGTVEELRAEHERFVGLSELSNRVDGGREIRRDRWLQHTREISRDPRMLAYFPMSQDGLWKRTLFDASPRTRDGAIVAAQRTVDRFGYAGGALDFSPSGSRVRINVPEELNALTFVAWVKIDSLDRWYNSLLLTDGHELHEPHWQIMDDGRVFFSVKAHEAPRKVSKKFQDKHIVYSPSIWSPSNAGKWTQLAVTYDGSNGEVIHYVNGSMSYREMLPENMRVETVRIGPATIGNWSEPKRDDPGFAVRNLNGSMDEISIFSAVLPASDVMMLYDKGRP